MKQHHHIARRIMRTIAVSGLATAASAISLAFALLPMALAEPVGRVIASA